MKRDTNHGRTGAELYKAGEFENAFREYKIAAEAGDIESQIFLGYLYQNGIGISRDALLAEQWYRSAIDSGSPAAAYYLAHLLLVEGRKAESRQLLFGAASSGWLPAKYDVGRSELYGWYQPSNVERAIELLADAVASGHVPSRRQLATAKLRKRLSFRSVLEASWLIASGLVLGLVLGLQNIQDPRLRT